MRAHEQAHMAAAGGLATGAPRYTYERGPDGKRYAVEGEVQIASATVPGDPEKTAERAEQVQRAALAPASPSAQDRAVAARAAATATQARAEAAAVERAERAEAQDTEPDAAAARSEPDSDVSGADGADSESVGVSASERGGDDGAMQSARAARYESVAGLQPEAPVSNVQRTA